MREQRIIEPDTERFGLIITESEDVFTLTAFDEDGTVVNSISFLYEELPMLLKGLLEVAVNAGKD